MAHIQTAVYPLSMKEEQMVILVLLARWISTSSPSLREHSNELTITFCITILRSNMKFHSESVVRWLSLKQQEEKHNADVFDFKSTHISLKLNNLTLKTQKAEVWSVMQLF